jgi:hypothetical protein
MLKMMELTLSDHWYQQPAAGRSGRRRNGPDHSGVVKRHDDYRAYRERNDREHGGETRG